MVYKAKADRLERMAYLNAGRTGLKLPAVSLGLWHQFGDAYSAENVHQRSGHEGEKAERIRERTGAIATANGARVAFKG
ncbi:hypothetical protein ABE187_16315 [Bacillus cabrialesii]|uniref:hypothetical protein n=1 Tax=Bacillus cabrialesii TaxID=2487276 RepID=UPI003D1CF223